MALNASHCGPRPVDVAPTKATTNIALTPEGPKATRDPGHPPSARLINTGARFVAFADEERPQNTASGIAGPLSWRGIPEFRERVADSLRNRQSHFS